MSTTPITFCDNQDILKLFSVPKAKLVQITSVMKKVA